MQYTTINSKACIKYNIFDMYSKICNYNVSFITLDVSTVGPLIIIKNKQNADIKLHVAFTEIHLKNLSVQSIYFQWFRVKLI